MYAWAAAGDGAAGTGVERPDEGGDRSIRLSSCVRLMVVWVPWVRARVGGRVGGGGSRAGERFVRGQSAGPADDGERAGSWKQRAGWITVARANCGENGSLGG